MSCSEKVWCCPFQKLNASDLWWLILVVTFLVFLSWPYSLLAVVLMLAALKLRHTWVLVHRFVTLTGARTD